MPRLGISHRALHKSKFRVTLGLSKLNRHKFRNNINEAINSMCPIHDVLPVLRSFELTEVPNPNFLQIFFYGDKKFILSSE